MNSVDQLRILEQAKGDPALLSLALVELTLHPLSVAEGQRTREALLAAAVPHWCDVAFLAALLETSLEEATVLLVRIAALACVEPFPARGEDAVNVHDASRLPLREHLRVQQPALWTIYAQRAHAHLAGKQDSHARIEALYHLFAADMETAAGECQLLDEHFQHRGRPEERAALALALTELTAAGWLGGAAQVEALLPPLWLRVSRGEASQIETEASTLLSLSITFSRDARIADVHCLIGDAYKAIGNLGKAMIAYQAYLAIFQRLAERDPAHVGWHRELAVAHSRVGDIHQTDSQFDGALSAFQSSLAITKRLADQDPAHPGWQRDLAVAHSRVGDIHQAQRNLTEALTAFQTNLIMCQGPADQDPTHATRQRDLAIAHSKVGDIHQALGQLDDALSAYQAHLAIGERLAREDPSHAEWQRGLAMAHHRMGIIFHKLRKFAASKTSYRQAVLEMEKAVSMSPSNVEWQQDLKTFQNWRM